MSSPLNRIFAHSYASALTLNDKLVVKAIADNGPFKTVLDVGCWDGKNSLLSMEAAHCKNRLGIELVESAAKEARKKGMEVAAIAADQDRWPWPDESIYCITSNQVVEHLSNLDHFWSEANRVLKPGGVVITSTNNLASWHNIWALVFGWTPFDLTNASTKQSGLGNPLAVHKGETQSQGDSWTHKCIYTARQLFEWQELYGLKREKLYTAGYYPLPASLGRALKTHAAFIITVTRKSKK